MTDDRTPQERAHEEKSHPHPLPHHSRRKIHRNYGWFILLLVLLAALILALMFAPF